MSALGEEVVELARGLIRIDTSVCASIGSSLRSATPATTDIVFSRRRTSRRDGSTNRTT